MLERIGGAGGLVGLLAMLGGIGVLALVDLRIAGGVALVLAGTGLLVRGLVRGVLASMGMEGML